jgi:hypothetical protein
MRYTIKDFKKEFNTDAQCVRFVFTNRYGKDYECPQCHEKGKFYLIENRKRFDCVCGFATSPLAGTIFHKSSTPLTLWFHAIFLFANSRNGVAAKELQRQLGVTYKCAWRIKKTLQLYIKPDIIERCYRLRSVRSVAKLLIPIVIANTVPTPVSLSVNGEAVNA